MPEPVVLEDHAVKFEVLEREKVVLDWVKLGVRLGDCRVVKTARSAIIHPGKLRGFDVDELEVDAGRIVELIKPVLKGRFGMVLSDQGVALHKPVYRFYSEEAKEGVKHGTVTIEGPDGVQSSIDNSPQSTNLTRSTMARSELEHVNCCRTVFGALKAKLMY